MCRRAQISSSRTTLSSVPQDLPQRGTRSYELYWGILYHPSSQKRRLGLWSQGQESQGTFPIPLPTHIDAILAGLSRRPLGTRGASRSHFLKLR